MTYRTSSEKIVLMDPNERIRIKSVRVHSHHHKVVFQLREVHFLNSTCFEDEIRLCLHGVIVSFLCSNLAHFGDLI